MKVRTWKKFRSVSRRLDGIEMRMESLEILIQRLVDQGNDRTAAKEVTEDLKQTTGELKDAVAEVAGQ